MAHWWWPAHVSPEPTEWPVLGRETPEWSLATPEVFRGPPDLSEGQIVSDHPRLPARGRLFPEHYWNRAHPDLGLADRGVGGAFAARRSAP